MPKNPGPVFRMRRSLLKDTPPSRDTAIMMPSRSSQMVYRVPSGATTPSNPSSAPLSSRGSPGTLLNLMGFDQVAPPSLERENKSSLVLSVNWVQPTYRSPAGGPAIAAMM